MKVRVQLPPVLRHTADGARMVSAEGASIAEVIAHLAKRNPALALHFYDEGGRIRRNIVFLHAGEAVRANDAGSKAVNDGDEIVITNALAGG